MKTVRRTLVALAAVMATAAFAADEEKSGNSASPVSEPAWEFAISAYPTSVRGGENYTSAIATANHGALHLEARYNYESIGARSVFVGWNLSGGEEFTWKLTPLLGGAWGTTQAFAPGIEVSLAWKQLDFYSEAEYVRDSHDRAASYLYSWNELGFRPVEWLRVGVVGQRTRAYGNDINMQRGPFAQLTWEHVTVGGYWFNPGSGDQVLVGLISVTF